MARPLVEELILLLLQGIYNAAFRLDQHKHRVRFELGFYPQVLTPDIENYLDIDLDNKIDDIYYTVFALY